MFILCIHNVQSGGGIVLSKPNCFKLYEIKSGIPYVLEDMHFPSLKPVLIWSILLLQFMYKLITINFTNNIITIFMNGIITIKFNIYILCVRVQCMISS